MLNGNIQLKKSILYSLQQLEYLLRFPETSSSSEKQATGPGL